MLNYSDFKEDLEIISSRTHGFVKEQDIAIIYEMKKFLKIVLAEQSAKDIPSHKTVNHYADCAKLIGAVISNWTVEMLQFVSVKTNELGEMINDFDVLSIQLNRLMWKYCDKLASENAKN